MLRSTIRAARGVFRQNLLTNTTHPDLDPDYKAPQNYIVVEDKVEVVATQEQ